MPKTIAKLLNIYEDEIGLFLWSTLLLFLIHSSDILFNNFAETTFLKRFGVEYLPMIFMINSISTFFVMGVLSGIMARLTGTRMLTLMLVICGASVGFLRLMVPLGFDILYPILYLLKSQYEVLLGLLFWNLANDLFNMRQSKRLFPLISAGGVVGGIIGSFGTPILVKWISIDNLMWVYLVTSLMGAAVVHRMSTVFPALLQTEKKSKTEKKRSSFKEEFTKVIPLIKKSDLVKALVLLTLLPNFVIPIINYQFNFAIDEAFATEGGMIKFFGYFRGAMNIVSFVILLFVGRMYGRWGLPVALMFHPINYLITFFAFLVRFDIFSAMYARLSTTVLRNTINNPARGVLMGLFPAAYRASIRPFLRGTVVRVGTLLGSGLIILFEGLFHPRFLSIIAIVFVVAWLGSTIFLKKRYSRILLDLISSDMLDLKSLEEKDVGHIFMDKKIHSQLVEGFLNAKGNTCLWYAHLLKNLGIDHLDRHILSIIKKQDKNTQIGLLSLLSMEDGKETLPVLEDLLDRERPELSKAAIKAAVKLTPHLTTEFLKKAYREFDDPEIKAHAVIGLYKHDKKTYLPVIKAWLTSADARERRAGIIATGGTENEKSIPVLKKLLEREKDASVIPSIISSLDRLKAPDINDIAIPYLKHPLEDVRRTALNAIDISDDKAMRAVLPALGDDSPDIQELSRRRLLDAPYHDPLLLIGSLSLPDRQIREGVFSLLESLQIKDVDVMRFARAELEQAYGNLAEAAALSQFPESVERDLLIDHLIQKKKERLETVIRVLATQDRSGELRVIWRGLSSSDSRQKSNALEALEDSIGHALSQTMVPLLEELPVEQALGIGKKAYHLPDFDSNRGAIYAHLISKPDWVTVILSLNLIGKEGYDGLDQDTMVRLAKSEDSHIRLMAKRVVSGNSTEPQSQESIMEAEISIPDKIIHLKGIQIFENLSVGELAAIASVTEEEVFPEGKDVIKEGDQGETMYLITSGAVSVIKGQDNGHEIELDKIEAGDYFGEMALFEDEVRSATIRTKEETRLLVLHKREFDEIVREYPTIALHICKVLSQRIRKLHEKVREYEQG